MSLLRLTSMLGILLFATALYAFDNVSDSPERVIAPKFVKIQLCSPSSDAGAGCNPAGRVSKSTTFCVRNGINATVATARYGISQLATTPRHVRETISATAASIRGASDVSVRTTDSALTVLYSLTAGFLRIVSSSFSALVSAIWPF